MTIRIKIKAEKQRKELKMKKLIATLLIVTIAFAAFAGV